MFTLSDILLLVSDNTDRDMLSNLFENAPNYITERSVVLTLQPGQTLISTDQKADKIYIHITGKLLGVDTFEPDIIYNFMEFYPVNIIGEFEAFSNKKFFQINIVAKTKSKLLVITVKDFLNWMQSDIKALNIITRLIALKVSSDLKVTRRYLFLNSYDRLLIYLFNYCNHPDMDKQIITIHKKQRELADELGFSEKTITRAINKLVTNGFLSSGRNSIKITEKQFDSIKNYLEERQII